MTPPTPSKLYSALAATWPAARVIDARPWAIRDGSGGGQRVSSALAQSAVTENDIETAVTAMQAVGQPALFMIRDDDTDLDRWLDARGFDVLDSSQIYVARARDLAQSYPITTIIPAWPPLAIQLEIWAIGGVGDARVAVMNRAGVPKTSLVTRIKDSPAATVFLAQTGSITMLHALEVGPNHRRRGVGEITVRAAAKWAVDQGSDWLALAVTHANSAANALYRKLGMAPVAGYHYRRASGSAS